jgi:hypothetical protein
VGWLPLLVRIWLLKSVKILSLKYHKTINVRKVTNTNAEYNPLWTYISNFMEINKINKTKLPQGTRVGARGIEATLLKQASKQASKQANK